MDKPFIGFEGSIGAGKTTLAHLLAAHLSAALILEDVDGNDFLADFYDCRERWALPMQLWFLSARHAQLAEGTSSTDRTIVSDYTSLKDGIFAGMLLHTRELSLYRRLSWGLAEVRRPDVFVYLDAENEILLQRIAQRGRPYEKHITATYLEEVREAHNRYFQSSPHLNVFRYDTSTLNLSSASELSNLFDRILRSAVGPDCCAAP